MKKEEIFSESDTPSDLITQSEAAEVSKRSIAAINELVRRGRLSSYQLYGRTLVSRSEVETFEPSKGGRPSKAKASGLDGKVNVKQSKRGSKKQ